MAKEKYQIKEPLCQGDNIPRWRLSWIASELYQAKQLPALQARIWEVLKVSGLHPLGKIEVNKIHQSDWEIMRAYWREKVLERMTKKDRAAYLVREGK